MRPLQFVVTSNFNANAAGESSALRKIWPRSFHLALGTRSDSFTELHLKGSFTYYVISRGGGGGFQMLTVDYGGGGGGLVVDYVIKIFIFYQFWKKNFG